MATRRHTITDDERGAIVPPAHEMTPVPHSAAKPRIAIIIPCRDHADELQDCLESIGRQRFSGAFEVTVVDSAGDPEVAAVAARFPYVRLVRSAEPLLAGPARNLGVAATAAPLLAFIDADCVAEPDWLARAHAVLSNGADAVGGPVGDVFPWHPIAVADNLLQFYELTRGRPAGPVPYLPACNLAVRREVFDALGGFSATVAGEDVLLTRQIAERAPDGLRFEPAIQVRHRGRRQFPAFWRHHRIFGQARGEHALMARRLELRFAASRGFIALLIVKRLAYMMARIARWSPGRLPEFVLLFPLLVLGVTSWALGVVEGSQRRIAASARGNRRSVHPAVWAQYLVWSLL
jgi:glycosyltransferase involved in cell wall biosynthesis